MGERNLDEFPFEDPDFDAEDWAEDFEDAATIGDALSKLLDRPTTTTVEDGSTYTTVVFVGQELDAVQALVQRLRALE